MHPNPRAREDSPPSAPARPPFDAHTARSHDGDFSSRFPSPSPRARASTARARPIHHQSFVTIQPAGRSERSGARRPNDRRPARERSATTRDDAKAIRKNAHAPWCLFGRGSRSPVVECRARRPTGQNVIRSF